MVPRKSCISEIFDPISKSRKLFWRVTKSRFSCVSFGLGVSNFFRKVSESRICIFSRGSPGRYRVERAESVLLRLSMAFKQTAANTELSLFLTFASLIHSRLQCYSSQKIVNGGSGNENVSYYIHSACAHAHLIRFPLTITMRTLWCWNRTKTWSMDCIFSRLGQRIQVTRFRFYKGLV